MDDTIKRGLTRLQNPNAAALAELAHLVVVEATNTKIAEIATPRWLASQIATALEAATRGDLARDAIKGRINHERARWSSDARPLKTWLAPEVEEPIRRVLKRPYTPNEALVMNLIDHGAIHELVGQVLTTALSRFSTRIRSLDDGMLGGIGGRAARRGKKLFGGLSSGLADNLVGAVKEELDQAMENRVKEFAAQATGEAMRTIARYAADPENAESFANLRVSLFDYALEMPMNQLASEADKLNPEELVDIVISTVRSILDDPEFISRTEERIAQVLEEAGDGTLRAWLDEVGLTEVWTQSTTELIADRLTAVVNTDAFEAWWVELFA